MNGNNKIILKCKNCNSYLKVDQKFCGECGAAFSDDNVIVELSTTSNEMYANTVSSNNNNGVNLSNTISPIKKDVVNRSKYDEIYNYSEKIMVEKFIMRHMERAGIDLKSKLIPADAIKKKKILNILFSILIFMYVSLIFFHLSIYAYLFGFIILLIFFICKNNFNLVKYLKKQVIARPSEKISNIVMSAKNTLVNYNSRGLEFVLNCVAVILPLIIFYNPHIFYEKNYSGYMVRFYTIGVTNFKTVEIPETYKNETINGIRGKVFANMYFLTDIKLPNTITEIRGQAFKNDVSLTNIDLPDNLTYLGGGAFYNCSSLEEIEIPDSVVVMGGETFYNATSLRSVKLPKNLEEIRGNTFEYCSSLESIEIPDSVTRIAAHAFYGNSSLKEVTLTKNSSLTEIGSSAFRECYALEKIVIPRDTDVNIRAFKDSPTAIYYFNN